MKFWDREKEVKDLKAHIESEPNSILFVYGPKSSGKSTLLEHVIQEIKSEKKTLFFKKYQVYWFDLRGKFLLNYERVVDLFFSRKRETKQRKETRIELQDPIFKSFKVSKGVYKEIKEREIDPFEYMEEEIEGSGRKTVIVFDELQRLKEIYINGNREVVHELFNFFVRLTKVKHLAHVFVMTSDTFFIEEVYTSSSLKNTSEYYLVDYFDDDTALRILMDEGLSEEDAKYAVEWIGGVPWMMERVLSNGNVREKIGELYKQHRARILGYIDEKRIRGEDIRTPLKVVEKVLQGKFPESGEELLEMRRLVEAEILFFDPINRLAKFQTKLDEKAAREILEHLV